jgi:hypothetical protein
MGASCSTGEGTRLESTASLERRFEGAGCNGWALGGVPLSHVPEPARFRRSFVVLLDFWGSTEGPTLRFSRWRGVIHRIYDRRGDKPITGFGAGWCQDGNVRPLPFDVLEARGMGWCVCGRGCARIQKLSFKLGDLALDGLAPQQFLLLSVSRSLHLLT